jgi:hypothetical protein
MLADGHESCFEKLDTIFPGSNSNKLRSKFEQTRPSPEKMATMRGIESSRNFAKYFSPSAAAFRRNRQWLFGPWKSKIQEPKSEKNGIKRASLRIKNWVFHPNVFMAKHCKYITFGVTQTLQTLFPQSQFTFHGSMLLLHLRRFRFLWLKISEARPSFSQPTTVPSSPIEFVHF